jgi:tetratricopeptide (TPR) repeat protein
MPPTHLDVDILERFAASDLDPERMIEAGRHLSACAPCRSRLRGEVAGGTAILERLARKGWSEEAPTDYEGVFERLQAKALERIQIVEMERQSAPKLAAELLACSFSQQLQRIGQESRFHSTALADLLLEQSSAFSREEPARAEETARLSLEITNRIESDGKSQALASDLKARAWAYIGNARRILSDFDQATSSMAKAESFLESGSGDPLERARVLDLKASLLSAQRRFDQALKTIDLVISIYHRVREPHREGRALVSKAMILGYAGEQVSGIPLFFRALQLIDQERDPHLVLAAFNNLLVDLTDLGRYAEARNLLPQVKAKLEEVGTRPDRTRVCWTEARLEAQLGHTAEAEAKLRQVREEFIIEGNGYNAALASLDLAKIFLGQGRMAETRQLAVEMHQSFASRNVQRETLVALIFFQQAAEQEKATVGLVEQVTQYLRRGRGKPELRFETPAA